MIEEFRRTVIACVAVLAFAIVSGIVVDWEAVPLTLIVAIPTCVLVALYFIVEWRSRAKSALKHYLFLGFAIPAALFCVYVLVSDLGAPEGAELADLMSWSLISQLAFAYLLVTIMSKRSIRRRSGAAVSVSEDTVQSLELYAERFAMDENPYSAPQAESARKRAKVRRWTPQQVWVGCVLAVLVFIAIVGVYRMAIVAGR